MSDPSPRLQNLPKAVLPPLSPLPSPRFTGGSPPKTPFGITHQERQSSSIPTKSAFPFQVSDASTQAGLRVYVRPGMVTSAYTTGSGYGWSGPPSNMHLDDSEPGKKLYLPITATGYVMLATVITDGSMPGITDVLVDYQTSIPAESETTARLVIAKVVVENGKIESIFQNVSSNLIHGIYFENYSFPDRWGQMIGPVSPSMNPAPA